MDCFYEGENMLVIHPDECIDCGVCEPECQRRDGGDGILRCPSLRLAGMNLVCQLDQLAFDPVG